MSSPIMIWKLGGGGNIIACPLHLQTRGNMSPRPPATDMFNMCIFTTAVFTSHMQTYLTVVFSQQQHLPVIDIFNSSMYQSLTYLTVVLLQQQYLPVTDIFNTSIFTTAVFTPATNIFNSSIYQPLTYLTWPRWHTWHDHGNCTSSSTCLKW